MSTFWLNNIHFAAEFFGAVSLVVAAWLAFDAYVLTREKKALLKVLGFAFFAAWQTLHALDIVREGVLLTGMALFVLGLFFIALNIHLEAPPPRPKAFELVFVIPSVVGLLGNIYLIAGGLSAISAVIAFRRYRAELNKPLKLVWTGFGVLALSFFASSSSAERLAPDTLWMVEHALRFMGFVLLTFWVWQYLRLRMKEELLLIFVAMSLVVSLVVTFTFSALLLARMRSDATESLRANAKVFSYTLLRLTQELKAKSRVAASDTELAKALFEKDFARIEERANALRERLDADFLTVADDVGEIVYRATYRTARGETILSDPAAAAALGGAYAGDLVLLPPEGLSVRGASPVLAASVLVAGEEGTVPEIPIGVLEIGLHLDNIFLDNFKQLTGLDATLFADDALHASSILDIDGATRPIGAKLTDEAVRAKVLKKGSAYVGSATFLGRPHLAAYLPLQDSAGSILGIVVTSRSEVEISKAAIATNRLTLFTTLAIVLALLIPAYFVVRKISEEE